MRITYHVPVIIAATVFLAGGGIAVLLFDRAEYVQARCDVDNESAVIWMASPSDIREGHGLLYNIDFQFPGPVIRFPPQFYAPDWADIDNVTMEYPNRNAAAGISSLRIREPSGSIYTQQIGLVKRDCWNNVTRFVKQVLSVRVPGIRIIEQEKKTN